MSTIDIHEDQQATIVEHFDRQWKYIDVPKHAFHQQFIEADFNDQQWSIIDLPHKQLRKKECICWYRKQFHWKHLSNGEQHIYLHFTANQSGVEENERKQMEIPAVTLWLNEKMIFNGSLGKEPLEITNCLKMDPEQNVFVICSKNGYALAFYARLLMPRIFMGQINYDQYDQRTSTRQHRQLDYTASFNDNHGLIDVFLGSYQQIAEEEYSIDANPEWAVVSQDDVEQSVKDTKIDHIPRLAIVMLIVGTRGDVQPFIALAKALLSYGHRVRLATHETFRKFVRENGIEFYPLAGNPADLMSFMVKNAGIVPSVSSVVAGDVGKSRQIIQEILESTWKACTEPDDETQVPFVAQAIIANPPSYGHIHCAQKLRIPLHMIFTMPWTPTGAFAHPFCRINNAIGPTDQWNRLSYGMIEMMTWSGLSDLINDFRKDKLKLPTLHTRRAIRMMMEECVPHTYCWSPALVPRPTDWPTFVNVSGFFFLDLGTNYTPANDLWTFLQEGAPPIYIGFGSITGHDSRRLLGIVLEALNQTGYRALLSGLATEEDQLPKNVFKIGNCPHDWLFQHVSAVCHHGGAGTTAAGLRAGKPTIIVPFFGDQFFWGSMISQSGAGPIPVTGKNLKTEDLVHAFHFVHQPNTREAAERLRQAFANENGCEKAVEYFHSHLPLKNMQSDLESTFAASLYIKEYDLKVSYPVAQALVAAEVIDEKQLSAHDTHRWDHLSTDDDSYMPLKNTIRHGQKAFNCFFSDTSKRLKRASDAKESAECIVKGVGKGLGHIAASCLSFYGDATDTLQVLPKLYDPYDDIDEHSQPQITGFRSGAKAAGNSIWFGFKDGVTGLVNKPRAGYHRDGLRGVAAGAVVSIPNVILKPVAGTLASITWLSRGVYEGAKHLSHKREKTDDNTLKLVNINGHRRSSSGSNMTSIPDDKTPEGRAALASGFTVEICRSILARFEEIKQKQSSSSTKRDRSKKDFQRQRSYSTNL